MLLLCRLRILWLCHRRRYEELRDGGRRRHLLLSSLLAIFIIVHHRHDVPSWSTSLSSRRRVVIAIVSAPRRPVGVIFGFVVVDVLASVSAGVKATTAAGVATVALKDEKDGGR